MGIHFIYLRHRRIHFLQVQGELRGEEGDVAVPLAAQGHILLGAGAVFCPLQPFPTFRVKERADPMDHKHTQGSLPGLAERFATRAQYLWSKSDVYSAAIVRHPQRKEPKA